MPKPREGLSASVLGRKLYAVGGIYKGYYRNTVWAYDPTTDTWTAKASMPAARGFLATRVVNGILYAVGGTGAGRHHPVFHTNYAFNPQ